MRLTNPLFVEEDELGLDRSDEGEAEGATLPPELRELGELLTPPEEGVDPVDLDLWVEKRLAALRQIDAEMGRNLALHQRMVEQANAWLEEQNAVLERRYRHLEDVVLQAARTYRFAGRKKSRELPSGIIGRKSRPARLKQEDKDAALAWAKTQDALRDEIQVETKVTEKLPFRVLREYWQSTGTVPEGCTVEPGAEEPYVKLKALEDE